MPTLSEERIQSLLVPYIASSEASSAIPANLAAQLAVYLELLLRWNAKTNLTAVRDPEEIVRRHFGESLFAGLCARQHLPEGARVLDLGSGAGFPGIPIQLLQPRYRVTLAESQGKKAAFLREVVRALGLTSRVWAGRVEDMASEAQFDAVTLRAVDRMASMVEVGRMRLLSGGYLVELTGRSEGGTWTYPMPERAGSYVRITRAE